MKNGGKSQTDQKIEGDREQVEDVKSAAGEKKPRQQEMSRIKR